MPRILHATKNCRTVDEEKPKLHHEVSDKIVDQSFIGQIVQKENRHTGSANLCEYPVESIRT